MWYGIKGLLLGFWTTRAKVERLRELNFQPKAIAHYVSKTQANVWHLLNTTAVDGKHRVSPERSLERFREPLLEADARGETLSVTAERLGITYAYLSLLRHKFGIATRQPGRTQTGWSKTADELDPELRFKLNVAPTRRKQVRLLLLEGASTECLVNLLGIHKVYVSQVRGELRDQNLI